MSDTPETDAQAYDVGGYQHEDGSIVLSAFARKLERERDRLAEQIKANHKGTLMLERMVYQSREQRDRLAEALDKVVDAWDHAEWLDENDFESFRAVLQSLPPKP